MKVKWHFILFQVTPAMRAGGSRIVCEPSYVPVENLVFGRLAFKGFEMFLVRTSYDELCLKFRTRFQQNIYSKSFS